MKLTLISGLFIILLCRNINFTNAADYTIYLIDNGFNPQSVTANVGDTVTFWDASIVDKFNRTEIRQIVQAVGDASGCIQSTDPGAFNIPISSTSPKSTVAIGSTGTIGFFCDGKCQDGFWGSIVVNDPNNPNPPPPASGNSTSSVGNPSSSGNSSSNSSNSRPNSSSGKSSPVSPYIDSAAKSPKMESWKVALIAMSSVSAVVLMLVVTYFSLRNKSAEQSKVTTEFVTFNNTNNTNVDSNNVDSNNVDYNNVDSNNVDSNNVDSNNVDSNNNVDANVDSNVDSNNVKTSNVDSNNSNSNNININNDNNV